MLRVPPFRYVPATSVDEAVRALAEWGPEAAAVAGGTDLLPNLKRGQFTRRVLVGLQGIRELHGIRPEPGGGLALGALMRLSALASDPQVREQFAAVAEAAAVVASPAIRNTATLGGNLLADTRCQYYNQMEDWRESLGYCMKCSSEAPCRVAPGSERCLAVSASDLAPALIALGAHARLAGPQGRRELPLHELYREDGIRHTSREPAEILTEVVLPAQNGARSTYLKLRRRGAIDFPIVGVAAALKLSEGLVAQAALVVGAVASCPLVVPEAADLVGDPPDAERISVLARSAARRAKPMENAELNLGYRKRMVQVFAARALQRLVDGPKTPEVV